MNNLTFKILPILCLVLLSCGSYEEKNYVPDDAVVVAQIDLGELTDKMDINELMKMDFVVDNIEDIEDEMPDFILELKKDPSKTGLDLSAPVTMFMNFGKKGSQIRDIDDYQRVGVILRVDDKEKVLKLVENLSEEINLDYSIRENDDEDYTKAYPKEKYDRNHAMVWNDEVLIFTMKTGGRDKANMSKWAVKLLSLEDEESLIHNNEAFEDFCSNRHDLDLFLNAPFVIKTAKKQMDLDDLRKDKENKKLLAFVENIEGYATGLNFDDEEIDLYSNAYFKDDEIANQYNILNEEGVSDDYMGLLSKDGKIMLAGGISINNKKLSTLLKNKLLKRLLEDELGTNAQDVLSVLNGQFAGSLAGFKETEITAYDYKYDYNTYQYKKIKKKVSKLVPIVNYQMGVDFSSKFYKKWEKEILQDESIQKLSKNHFTSENSDLGTIHIIKLKDRLFISNNKDASMVKSVNAWKQPDDSDIEDMLTDYPVGLYMNLDLSNEEIPDEFDVPDPFAKKWGSLRMHTNGAETNLKLKLDHEDDNTLHYIMKSIIKMGEDGFNI
ncbi:DUF4836 family protein [Bacteroidia bacterium]|nr:DUF4836 family protein [Bacteroidia bacterium]